MHAYVKEKNVNFSFHLFLFFTESYGEITEDSIAAMTELLLVKQQQRDEKKRKKKEEEENAAAEKKENELKRKYAELQQQLEEQSDSDATRTVSNASKRKRFSSSISEDESATTGEKQLSITTGAEDSSAGKLHFFSFILSNCIIRIYLIIYLNIFGKNRQFTEG